MLWSLTVTSKKPVAFHSPLDVKITKAILEPNVETEAVFLVHAKHQDPITEKDVSVPIAVLRAPVDSTPLELVINEDEEITFSISGGNATIHLTGYYIIGDEMGDEIDMEDLEDDLEDDEEEVPPPVVNENKRKIPLSVPPPKKTKVENNQNQKKGNPPPKKK